MSTQEALDEVRKDLIAAFGETLAGRIMDAARCTQQGAPDNAAFKAVVESLCRDERVLGMFGELGVRDKKNRWEKLV
jgi:aminoglycoside/choline kinase family phosphotransferase